MLLIDTAGRLHNKSELMAELAKVIRVIKKLDPSAPHAVLLTLDATTGQNAMNQVEVFRDQAGVTGLVMTKLDGTARGGILVAIAAKTGLPVHFIGVGEAIDDLAAVLRARFLARHRGAGLMGIFERGPNDPAARSCNPVLKLALELGPLAGVFLRQAYGEALARISPARCARRAAVRGRPRSSSSRRWWRSPLSLALTRRLPIMPFVTGIVVLIFGGLTLWLQDDEFIKMKPTIVNALFGVGAARRPLFGRPLLGYVFDSVFRLDDEGWRKLTLRWGIFFFVLAVLNEVIWRNFSTDFWVTFKVFGIMPLTVLFTLTQMPLIQRHTLPETESN